MFPVCAAAKNSGIALITVDERGQNTIVVAPGSNADMCPEDVKKLPVSPGDVVVCQFEIPPAAVAAAFAKARRYGARTILNPSPVCPIPEEIFRNTDILIVNETELAFLSRETSMKTRRPAKSPTRPKNSKPTPNRP